MNMHNFVNGKRFSFTAIKMVTQTKKENKGSCNLGYNLQKQQQKILIPMDVGGVWLAGF